MRLNMSKADMAKLQQAQAELRVALADPGLTPEQRAKLELHQYSIAGAMLSPLLPVGFIRKLWMFGWIVIAIGGAILGQPLCLLFLILAAMSSPRIVGEVSYARGWLTRIMGG